MYDTYIIETRKGAAGIVVRDGRGFRFFAATHDFRHLEGQFFSSPKDAEAAAQRHIRGASRSTEGVAQGLPGRTALNLTAPGAK
jgi:hypothetical protein